MPLKLGGGGGDGEVGDAADARERDGERERARAPFLNFGILDIIGPAHQKLQYSLLTPKFQN